MTDIEKRFNQYLWEDKKGEPKITEYVSERVSTAKEHLEKITEKEKQETTPSITQENQKKKDYVQDYLDAGYSQKEAEDINTYRQYIENMEERVNSPEYQEQVKKLKQLFSPETETIFAKYMLSRGYFTKEQFNEYIEKYVKNNQIQAK